MRLSSVLVFIALALSVHVVINAQSIGWEKTYGVNAAARTVEQTSDGGYILVGDHGTYPVFSLSVIRTDASGNKVWEKSFGGTDQQGYDNAFGYAVEPASDGGFVIAGARGQRVMLMKISSTGDSLWAEYYGGDGHGAANSLWSTGEGFVAGGYLFESSATHSDLHLFKVDGSGRQQWAKSYGGNGMDGALAVRGTTDGGYIVAGYLGTGSSSDPYLLKIDGSGDKQWEKSYPGIRSSSDRDEAADVRQTSDGYIVTGTRAVTSSSFDTDLFVLKTDGSGDKHWEKNFGDAGYDGGNSLRPTSDGGFVVTGWEGPSNTYMSISVYLLKLDSLGTKQWDMKPRAGFGHALLLHSDGSHIVAGGSGNQAYLAKIVPPNPQPSRYFVILDARGFPISHKEFTLYKASMQPGNDKVVATRTTDANGRIAIEPGWYKNRDSIRIARIVHTQPTLKPLHSHVNNVAYRIMLDNVKFDEVTSFPATEPKFDIYDNDPDLTEQRITLDHTTVLYDIIVSIEWDASDDYIADIAHGIPVVANYLYDVSDGQIGLGRVIIAENKELWNGADVLITATTETWPNAGVEGFLSSQIGGGQQAFLPPRWYGDVSFVRALLPHDKWLTFYTEDNWRNFAHELGHQLLGFRDEYTDLLGRNFGGDYNLGFMDSQFTPEILNDNDNPYPSQLDNVFSTEMSSEQRYRAEDRKSRQYVLRGGSCWDDYEQRYEKSYDGIFCPIIKPSERTLVAGAITLQGPNDRRYDTARYDASSMMQMTIYTNLTTPFNGITTVTIPKGGAPVPYPGMSIVLKRGTRTINLGRTNDLGQVRLLGALAGDSYEGTGSMDGTLHRLKATVPSRAGKKDENATPASAAANLDVIASPVAGTYTLVPTVAYQSDGRVEVGMTMNQAFSQDPSLRIELDSASTIDRTLAFDSQRSAYRLMLDSLPLHGPAILTGYDQARESFPILLNYSTTSFSTDVFGDNGGAWLLLDSANAATVEATTWLSSWLPTPMAGLASGTERGGSVHAVTFLSDDAALKGSNALTIRYAVDDLTFYPESSLRIFRWEETAGAWKEVGGTVDTIHNEVNAPIAGEGTYAAFTTGRPSGVGSHRDTGSRLGMMTRPVEGGTMIGLSLEEGSQTRVALYNTLGELVRLVVSKELAVGTHRFVVSHDGLPAGTYLCVVTTTEDVLTAKLQVRR